MQIVHIIEVKLEKKIATVLVILEMAGEMAIRLLTKRR